MRLHNTPEVLGRGFHRAGWPSLLNSLSQETNNTGTLFLNSAEIHLRAKNQQPIMEPWVGIWHLPPLQHVHSSVMDECINKNELFKTYSQNKNAQISLSNLQAFITLSDYARRFQHQNFLGVPGYTLRYPHEPIVQHNGKEPRYLLHNGTFLKNSAILNNFRKPWQEQIKLMLCTSFDTFEHHKFFKAFFHHRGIYNDITFANRMTDTEYDNTLKESMVIVEYMDCSASTTVVECIACNVPIVVNRHPAVVEYLGEDYPLFYDDYLEIPNLITKWKDAVDYLQGMNKTEFQIPYFIESLKAIMAKHGG